MNSVKDFEILDCTLRDGGYYTNWDFDRELVEEYYRAMESLPISYVEIGYRSLVKNTYLGEYFYCPKYVLERAKALMPSKKIVLILDEKNTINQDLDQLLDICKPYVHMIRMAIAPDNIIRAIDLAKAIKIKGFKVGFNVMYMSNWLENKTFLENLSQVDGIADIFYMVDSYGGILPDEVVSIIKFVKSKINTPLGFHGHNNLELAFINTLTALENGCSIVDATITGMGRGAGNLKTELFLTYLTSKSGHDIQFNELSNIVSGFEKLQKQYEWGTNLPYMFSGVNSLPQKDVMEWIGLNRYPIRTILTALKNKKEAISDNIKLPNFQTNKTRDVVLIIGGGKSVEVHKDAIEKLTKSFDNICIIHAGVRFARIFNNLTKVKQYYCLVGSEGYKLEKQFDDLTKFKHTCIFPPFPRKMGTVLPDEITENSYELKEIQFLDQYFDSPLTVALETATILKAKEIYLAGFDGYDSSINRMQFQLSNENQFIIDRFTKTHFPIKSCTLSKYNNLQEVSIYSLLK